MKDQLWQTTADNSFWPAPAIKEIQVFTLGRFLVRGNGKIVSGEPSCAQKPWELFKYLLSQREKPVRQETLIDLFWPEHESSDPGHALRNLAYRLRRIFDHL
jgi:two-component SAPR family response regulator